MIKFIDCDCLVGEPIVPLEHGIRPDPADLLREMDRLHIIKALVRHRACAECNPLVGNEALLKEIPHNDRLLPVKMVVPEGERPGFDPEAMVAGIAGAGFQAVWIHPKSGENPYPLRPWCAGKLLSALEEWHIPTLIQYDTVDLDELHETLQIFPRLPVLLLNIPRLGRHRVIWALAQEHSNLYLCISPGFEVLDGISGLCRLIGAERLVWGSGYPESEGGAAVTNLVYSGISRHEQEQIACNTIEKLLKEMRRG